MRIFLFAFLLLLAFSSSAQSLRVHGSLAAAQGEEYIGSITVFALPDSALLKGSYIDSALFSFELDRGSKSNFFARLRVHGCYDTLLVFSTQDSVFSFGEIQLNPILLDEVSVVYTKPLYEQTLEGIRVNVEGTNLQTLSNLFEVLKASPKIYSPNDQSIELVGKGVPLILIDRQSITSVDELKAVPANQIERIEIMTNPSAKYRAQGRGGGVIEVYTKNFRLEGYSMNVGGNTGINTQLKPNANLSTGINWKRKKFSLSCFIAGGYGQNVEYQNTDAITLDHSDRTYLSSFSNAYWWGWHHLNLKMAYELRKGQTISVGVRSMGGLSEQKIAANTRYLLSGSTLSDADENSVSEYNWINSSAFIKYQILTDTLGSSLEINLNYLLKTNGERGTSYSSFFDGSAANTQYFDRKTASRDRPNIGEIKLDYTYEFDTSGWSLNTGLAYSYLFNRQQFDQFNRMGQDWIADTLYLNAYEYVEQVAGVYAEVSKMWKKMGFRLGLRAEYTQLRGYSESLQKEFIDSSFLLPFPNASLILKPKEGLSMTFYYQSGINRPQFNQYDPFKRIRDSLTIEYGNPYLRPETSEIIGWETDVMGRVNISLTYKREHWAFSRISLMDSSSFLVNSTPWNADLRQSLSLELGIPINLKWLQGWNSISASYGRIDFGPEFGRAPFFTLNYGLFSRLSFILPKKFELTSYLFFNQYASDDFFVQPRVYWALRFMKKFGEGNFHLFCDVNDILAPKTRTISYSGNYELRGVSQGSFINFSLGFYYKFGKLKQAPEISESDAGQSGRI